MSRGDLLYEIEMEAIASPSMSGSSLGALAKESQMEATAGLEPQPSERVGATETGGGRYQVQANVHGSTFFVDEPIAVGGLGSGPNPYDLIAAALGACTAMTLRLFSNGKGWPLRKVSVSVRHARGSLMARDMFDREISIEGDLDESQRTRLLEVANRCPVHLSLERGSDVTTRLIELDPLLDLADHRMHMRDMLESCSPTSPRRA